ncbi:unnamed protein product [Effrenium voratum]|uniref:Uncharacterized protein n=1 Tax=Effrenium voratum TaxID=2562239 RepID=A0AA36MX36_9DINO|nr:unnamed protein product [Effrenium voratum]
MEADASAPHGDSPDGDGGGADGAAAPELRLGYFFFSTEASELKLSSRFEALRDLRHPNLAQYLETSSRAAASSSWPASTPPHPWLRSCESQRRWRRLRRCR